MPRLPNYQSEEGNIHLDHALNISIPSLPSSVERHLNKVLKSFERTCDNISHSINVVGCAVAAYLVMAGIARLIEARNKSLPPSQGEKDKGKNSKGPDTSGKDGPPWRDEKQSKGNKKSKEKNPNNTESDGKDRLSSRGEINTKGNEEDGKDERKKKSKEKYAKDTETDGKDEPSLRDEESSKGNKNIKRKNATDEKDEQKYKRQSIWKGM